MNQKKSELEALPAVDFWHVKLNTLTDDQKCEKDKDHYVTLEVPMDPNNDSDDAQTCTLHIKIFEAGTAEDYCCHRMKVHEAATCLGHFHRMLEGVQLWESETGLHQSPVASRVCVLSLCILRACDTPTKSG